MIGASELIAASIAVFFLFGPKKFPELARSFGRSVAQFRRSQINAAQGELDARIKKIAHELGIDTVGKSDEEILDEVQHSLQERRE